MDSPSNLPIDEAARRALERGLKCQRIHRKKRGGFDPRRLFIEGRKCQVVPASLYKATDET